MRWTVILAIGALWTAGLASQDAKPPSRYGVVAIFNRYPQNTPKDTLASVLKAIDNQHIDYLMAHLTDPVFVDQRVKAYGGKFEELVAESRTKLANNPGAVKQLRRFLEKGEWEENEDKDKVTVKLKDVPDQQVFLKRIDKRWFMENRMKPMAEK
jgi:hypothetical protein